MKCSSVIDLIGNTPILNITTLFKDAVNRNIEVWMKLEKNNPGASIKDRIAMSMILDAEKSGELKEGMRIVEATSGNTGIGLAMIAASRGYPLTIVMLDSVTVERRTILKAYGAELVLTPAEKGMKGTIEKANYIATNSKNTWMPLQFENLSNPKIHEETTAKEIIADFPKGFDYMFAGVGTGGHITGCSNILKEKFPQLKVFAMEPEKSAVISGECSGPHRLQGIGAGFIPKVLNKSVIDEVVKIPEELAFKFAKNLPSTIGLLAGISTGANCAGISLKLPKIEDNKTILTFCYDTGERYLSVKDLF